VHPHSDSTPQEQDSAAYTAALAEEQLVLDEGTPRIAALAADVLQPCRIACRIHQGAGPDKVRVHCDSSGLVVYVSMGLGAVHI
jgi:hypothetical protein